MEKKSSTIRGDLLKLRGEGDIGKGRKRKEKLPSFQVIRKRQVETIISPVEIRGKGLRDGEGAERGKMGIDSAFIIQKRVRIGESGRIGSKKRRKNKKATSEPSCKVREPNGMPRSPEVREQTTSTPLKEKK